MDMGSYIRTSVLGEIEAKIRDAIRGEVARVVQTSAARNGEDVNFFRRVPALSMTHRETSSPASKRNASYSVPDQR